MTLKKNITLELRTFLFGFLNSILLGIFASFAFVNPAAVGVKYFVYHGGSAIILIGISLYFLDLLLNPLALLLLVFATFYCLFANRKFALFLYFIAVASGYALLAKTEMQVINSVFSSLVLGFSLSGMLLGHWYLIEPKLSINELRRTCGILIALIVVRFCYGTFVAVTLLWGKTESEIYQFLFGTIGIFVMMRWAWGLLAPMVFSYMVWSTVKIRSTQSATGILYVLVLAILTGEALSRYLANVHGVVF